MRLNYIAFHPGALSVTKITPYVLQAAYPIKIRGHVYVMQSMSDSYAVKKARHKNAEIVD